ncbi:MAG: substrate-binding domain-containing protein [Mycoplasmatales bacterium]
MKKILSILVVAVFILAGCAGNSDQKTIGFSVSTMSNPFFNTMVEGAKTEAEKLGYKLVVVDAQDDSAKQLTDIEDLIAQNVDVVVVNPVDSKAVSSSVKSLNEKNIPVITVDRAAETGEIVSHIASDNKLGGKIAGDYAKELLPNGGDIVILEGIPGASATIERGSGFEDAVKGSLNVIEKQTANFDRAEGLKKMEDIISSKGKNIKLVFAHNDEMALGAVEALRAAGMTDVPVIGFDATDDAKAAIKEGTMKATIEQQPSLMGSIAVGTAGKVINGETTEANIPVEVKLVNE